MIGASTSGQAARTLGREAGIDSRTLASLLWRLDHDRGPLNADTASAWESERGPPSSASVRAMAASDALVGTTGAPVVSTPLRNVVAMAASTAMTDAGA